MAAFDTKSDRKQQVLFLSDFGWEHEKEILTSEGLSEVVHISESFDEFGKIAPEKYNQAVAILADVMYTLDKPFLDKMHKLRIIVRMGVGFDNINIKYAGSLGIAVVNIPDYGIDEVADSGISLIMNLYRQTFNLANRIRDGQILSQKSLIELAPSVRRIRGKKLGLIGLGKIGFSLAIKCKAIGFHVQYYDPYINISKASEYTEQFGIFQKSDLFDMLGDSDCIVILCPLTNETKHLVNENSIEKMKDNAFLVNVSRGGIVDENALAVALKCGKLAGAGLDVHESEPFVFANSPLNGCDNIICTPHSAFYSPESIYEMATKACHQVSIVLKGNTYDKLQNCVNMDYLDIVEVNKRWK